MREPPLTRLHQLGPGLPSPTRAALTASRVGLVVLSSRRTSLEEPSPASPYAILLDAVHDELSAGELAGTDGFGAEQIADPICAWSMEWPCSSRLTCAD